MNFILFYLPVLITLNTNIVRTENDNITTTTTIGLSILNTTTVGVVNLIKNNTVPSNVITSQFNPILRKPTSPSPSSTSYPNKLAKFIKKINKTNSNEAEKNNVKEALASLLLENKNQTQIHVARVNLLNRCWLQPCMNNATCYGSVYSYHCFCQPGYVGINCEIKLQFNVTKRKIKKCHDSYCNQKGDCYVNYDAKKYCKCIDGYFGINCEMHYYRNNVSIDKYLKLTSSYTTPVTLVKHNPTTLLLSSSTTTANDTKQLN